MNIPVDFSMRKVPLMWSDVVWAYHRNILTWKDLVAFADSKVLSGDFDPYEMEISLLGKDNITSIAELAETLAKRDNERLEDTRNKWLFILLSWIFENRNNLDDPLALVEDVYADFDYPTEIQSFVRYMPATDGYDPRKHTSEENKARMMRKFEEFLVQNSFTGAPS
jgi:hypothetical protein